MQSEAFSCEVERRLTNFLPSEALEDHADAVGVIQRDRKLQIPPLVWSFAFGFGRRFEHVCTGRRATERPGDLDRFGVLIYLADQRFCPLPDLETNVFDRALFTGGSAQWPPNSIHQPTAHRLHFPGLFT